MIGLVTLLTVRRYFSHCKCTEEKPWEAMAGRLLSTNLEERPNLESILVMLTSLQNWEKKELLLSKSLSL